MGPQPAHGFRWSERTRAIFHHIADCVDAETIVRCMPALETQHIATAESMVRRSRTFDSGLLQLGTRVPCDREFMRAKRPAGTTQGGRARPRPTHDARQL